MYSETGVSDMKSKACLCICRTRLSSEHTAVCWLFTKSMSPCALLSASFINTNYRDICPSLYQLSSHPLKSSLLGHLPLFFQNESFYVTHSVHLDFITFFGMWWEKKATVIWNVISLWFMEIGLRALCFPFLMFCKDEQKAMNTLSYISGRVTWTKNVYFCIF